MDGRNAIFANADTLAVIPPLRAWLIVVGDLNIVDNHFASVVGVVNVAVPIHVPIPIEAHEVFGVLIAQGQCAAVGSSLVKDGECEIHSGV